MVKLILKRTTIFFASLVTFMIHLPFAFANSKPVIKISLPMIKYTANMKAVILNKSSSNMSIYEDLKLNSLGMSSDAFKFAIQGFENLKMAGRIFKDDILTIVDFTKPSSEKRLFIIDMKNRKILFNTYVAHGQKSGAGMATTFSNTPESFQSSLGLYETTGTYIGKNGYSMRLDGLENGINDKAEERAIVMHGAPYVSEGFIKARGYLGRSWGCPAVPENLNRPIIDRIKNGSCLFIYSNDKTYIKKSKVINS